MDRTSVFIAEREIGSDAAPYLIAEIGINHGGDLDAAKRLVEAAASAGADAAKLQTYQTEQRVPRDSSIFSVLKECELDLDAHRALKRTADDVGIALMSTGFDAESLEILAAIEIAALKIASFDIVNLELIDAATKLGRPLVMSRGMASAEETRQAVAAVEAGRVPLVLLHCVSAYPLDPADANLAVIGSLMAEYAWPVGFSDHSLGSDTAFAAVAAGASVVEKHFTLDREAPGPDHAMSADPEGLRALRKRIDQARELLGSGQQQLLDAEAGTVPFRRFSGQR